MSTATVNGITISYRDTGSGDPVVLVMGTGSGGRVWDLHQVPELVAAGFRVVTYDNRGIPPTDVCADGFTIDDLAADLAGLIDLLGLAPCRLIGTSMGAWIVQELVLARPDLARQVVLMATRARSDQLRTTLAQAEIELHDKGVVLPPAYAAAIQALQNLSPSTLDDDAKVRDWLDIFELSPGGGPGLRAQLALDPMPDRRAAYARIRTPCHVIAFADDLVTPPHLGAEVARAIPGASFETIANTGHYGYLEDPAAVNKSILGFFQRTG
jgi:pimeloyl-ACP methyl ester carboxylesterase